MPVRFPASVERVKYYLKVLAQTLIKDLRITWEFVSKVARPARTTITTLSTEVIAFWKTSTIINGLTTVAYMLLVGVAKPIANLLASFGTSTSRSVMKVLKTDVSYLLGGVLRPASTTVTSVSLTSKAVVTKVLKPTTSYTLATAVAPTPTTVSSSNTSVSGWWST